MAETVEEAPVPRGREKCPGLRNHGIRGLKETGFVFGGRFHRKSEAAKSADRIGKMDLPDALHNGRDLADIHPEVAVYPEEQNVSVARYIPDPEVVRHEIPPTQSHHQRVDENVIP